MDNQCWKDTILLLDEEKFKFLVHSDDGGPWLATTDQEMSKLVEEIDKEMGQATEFVVHTLSTYPDTNTSLKMEVGIEDCLHIEFEYNKQK